MVLDVLVTAIVGFIVSLATGAFFASRSRPGDPKIEDLLFRPTRVYRFSVSINHHHPSLDTSTSTSENLPRIIVLISLVAFVAGYSLFAAYNEHVLYYGWIFISLLAVAIVSFVGVHWYRIRTVDLFSIWCLFCLAAISYNFWLFSGTLTDPDYLAHLQFISSKICPREPMVIEPIPFNMFTFWPVFQLIALASIIFVAILASLQALAILIWPLAQRNSQAAVCVLRWCIRYVNGWAILGQIILLVLAYVVFSGMLI